MNRNVKIAKQLVRIAKMLVSSTGDDIESMSTDEKINLAKNKNASPEILEKLADDEDANVRYYVAENPKTPADILKKLAREDEESGVRQAVAYNPNTPADILKKLAEDKDDDVKWAVAANTKTPVDILKKLADDKDDYVKSAVVDNPNAPVEVLKKLAEDEDERIRRIAERALRKRGQ